MGSSVLIGLAVVIAAVLIVFGLGVGVVPLLLVLGLVVGGGALLRRSRESKQVRDFRRQSGLGDGTEEPDDRGDRPIHGPVG